MSGEVRRVTDSLSRREKASEEKAERENKHRKSKEICEDVKQGRLNEEGETEGEGKTTKVTQYKVILKNKNQTG